MRVPKLRRNGDGRAFAEYPRSGRKREYFGTYGTPEAEERYRQWLVRVLTQGNAVVEGRRSGHVIMELGAYFLNHLRAEYEARPTRSGRTEFSAFRCVLNRIVELAGQSPAEKITPNLLRTFQQHMLQDTFPGKDGKPQKYSRSHINRSVARVKLWYRWCCDREYLPPEWRGRLDGVQALRQDRSSARETEPIQPVSWEIVEQTLPHLNRTVAAMVQIQYFCGMRPGEVCRMRWSDIDREADVWLYVPSQHKNTHRGQRLLKAIPKAAQGVLLGFEREDETEYIFSPRETMAEVREALRAKRKTPVQPSQKNRSKVEPEREPGERYPTNSYANAIKKAAAKAGVPHWTPNQLRHSIATEIRSRYGMEQAQFYLGHAQMDTTSIYAERTAEAIQELARKLDREVFHSS